MFNIKDLRQEYTFKSLDLEDLDKDPFKQLHTWLQEAYQHQAIEPNAMVLATANAQGKPSSRTILLKGLDTGLIFFTNYESRKAKEIAENPFASAVFFWKELQRQATIDGKVEMLSREESSHYFSSRPRGNQLGSWASHQDQIISSRELLEQEYKRLEEEFKDKPVPLPPYWGGYRLIPTQFEFWQGRPSRLHDRFRYYLTDTWQISRLSP